MDDGADWYCVVRNGPSWWSVRVVQHDGNGKYPPPQQLENEMFDQYSSFSAAMRAAIKYSKPTADNPGRPIRAVYVDTSVRPHFYVGKWSHDVLPYPGGSSD